MTGEAALPRQVFELDARTFADAIDDLATLLVDAVESGASVGFVLPFTHDDARAWWRSLSADVAAGRIVVLIARVAEGAVGTAQLRLNLMPNGLHRTDVAKVLVRRSARRRGVARMLMACLEESARRRGRTLLVLDTITGSDAVKLYESLGWTRAGEIPRYAAMPDGTLAPTTYFFKELS
jgi:ribosomal protein S18 acetylase RimI-like enzyme